ncbi:MAG TPA: glycosyltransferase [Solirubrobacteraceae bacterium]|nr:glycosyltransferase [Solirubrobacteraceae bacterium]
MNAHPRFSVVIAAFNAAGTVSSAVRSVLTQTNPDLEVIVVDDGSTDGTDDVVRRIDDPRVRYLSQPNRGPAAARNAGIEQARGKYVAFLDSDDLYLPSFLERGERALKETPGAGFAYTDAYVFDAVSGKVRRRSAMDRNRPPVPPPADREAFLLELLRRNFVYVAVIVPSTVLERVGGFEESLKGPEDYELWLRILTRGYRAAWISGRQALYRKHAAQLSGNVVTMTRSLCAVYEGLRMEELPGPEHRELLVRRRRETRHELRLQSRFGGLLPLGLVSRLKRAGIGESWYDSPPADIAAAFPDLTAV